MTAEMVENAADQPHSPSGIPQDQLFEQPTGFARQRLTQPNIHDLQETEVRLVAVYYGRAGVDVGFDGVGCDQPLTETVDGRTGDLVNRLARSEKMVPLILGQPIWQGRTKFGRDTSSRQFTDEFAHSNEKFAGGKLSERYRGDELGFDAVGQQHGNTARQHRSLARPGTSFNQKGAIMDRDGRTSGGCIGERYLRRPHHAASHIPAASPSRRVAASIFRAQYPALAFAGSAKARSS